MSVFKKAYARGVAEKLAREGIAKFASAEAAEKIADACGEAFTHEPATDGPVPVEKTAELIEAILVKVADSLSKEMGNLIVGDKEEHQNNAPNAASQVGGLAAMDQKDRPQGTYVKGERAPGASDLPMSGAQVGKEDTTIRVPQNTDNRPNSANALAKVGSLREMINKIAKDQGALIVGDKAKHQNNAHNAATEVGGLAAMDQKDRPQGTYAKGERNPGATDLDAPKGSHIGKEDLHARVPQNTDQKHNSAVHAAKTGAYMARFEETAREYVGKLPSGLNDDEKVAAVKHLMGLEAEEAEGFLAKLADESGPVPQEIADAKDEHERKETTSHEVAEHKAEEKKEEKAASEKEAAPHRRKYTDPYGYTKYDAKGKDQQGPEKKASAILAGLRSLSKK